MSNVLDKSFTYRSYPKLAYGSIYTSVFMLRAGQLSAPVKCTSRLQGFFFLLLHYRHARVIKMDIMMLGCLEIELLLWEESNRDLYFLSYQSYLIFKVPIYFVYLFLHQMSIVIQTVFIFQFYFLQYIFPKNTGLLLKQTHHRSDLT